MPYLCCVSKCSNSVLHPERRNYSFHRFPRDERFINKWLDNIKRPDLAPTKHTRICSVHFEDWCFLREEPVDPLFPFRRRNLRPEAVPTLFNDDINLVKRVRKFGNRKNKKQTLLQEGTNSSSNSSEVEKSTEGTPSGDDQSFQQHSITYETLGFNGHSEFETPRQILPEKHDSPDADTYELTELTPMVKQERMTPLSHSYEDTNSACHLIANLDQPNQVPTKDLSINPSVDYFATVVDGTETTIYSNAFKKCMISETFLHSILKLIKCPQCGYYANSEQMHKYENQGCLLGVRLQCYNGHLVLDWRL